MDNSRNTGGLLQHRGCAKFIQQEKRQVPKNNEALLIGDINGTMDDEDIANILAETGLYDLLATKHGSSMLPTYV
eukprot:13114853-Ditylum_brightwellii.AAC.1